MSRSFLQSTSGIQSKLLLPELSPPIMTRVPKGNLGALALVRAIKGVYEFTNPRGWVMDGDPVPAEIYSMQAQNWIRDADGLRPPFSWRT
jgi:hypothetical protein